MPLRLLCALVIWSGVVSVAGTGFAQPNVKYDSSQNPYLYLLREPAVHDALRLTESQRRRLFQVNDRFDGPLLAMRIAPPEMAQQELARILSGTQSEVETILEREQRKSLDQIQLRLAGVACLQIPAVATRLQLRDEQRRQIDAVVEETQASIRSLYQRAKDGGKREELEKEYAALRLTEKDRILRLLSPRQKSDLASLLGKTFDVSKLGRVAFKAPEIAPSDEWLHSPPLQMADLKGQVVALHFLTFG